MTPHPCKGMTRAQRRDFELIATGHRPRGGDTTINKLRARGLIADAPQEVLGRDVIFIVPVWYVPIPIHMQWCKWAAEQSERAGAAPTPGETK